MPAQAEPSYVDGHPQFTGAEMTRRHEALLAAAAERGLPHVLVVGAERSGSGIQWLTGWPVTKEAYAVCGSGERDALFVGFYNHVPQARELARDADVEWVGASPAATVLHELRRRGARRAGVIGPLSARLSRELQAGGVELVPLDDLYTRLRQVKSAEEVAWLREGAALSDRGIAALCESLRSGLTEYELCDVVERAYVPLGGTTHIHYFGVTPMSAPDRTNPTQYPSARRVRPGDAVVLELSAAFRGYAGQVLRTFAVESEPTSLYTELHDVAEQAFAAVRDVLRPGTTQHEIQEAASVIEEAGFTTVDDLVHGFGGGYLPPVIGSRSRDVLPPAEPLQAGMTLVVQPNVTTTDLRAGVQYGELLHVTEHGAERLHDAPGGLLRVG